MRWSCWKTERVGGVIEHALRWGKHRGGVAGGRVYVPGASPNPQGGECYYTSCHKYHDRSPVSTSVCPAVVCCDRGIVGRPVQLTKSRTPLTVVKTAGNRGNPDTEVFVTVHTRREWIWMGRLQEWLCE